MKHVAPESLSLSSPRWKRIALAAAYDHHQSARFKRSRAVHKLRIGDHLGHSWLMKDAIREWAEAKFYYRRARNV